MTSNTPEPEIIGFDDTPSTAERIGKLLQARGASVPPNTESALEATAAQSQRISEAISKIAVILRAGNDFDPKTLTTSLDELALMVSTL